MLTRRWLLIVALAVVAGWSGGSTSAQSTIPNGVFIQDGSGYLWLVLDGKKVNVPVWMADHEDVRQLPKSDRWAVMNDAGAIVAGDIPPWVSGDGLAGPFLSPLQSRTIVQDVFGQEAVGTFTGEPIKATVQEMSILDALPEFKDRSASYFQEHAQGKFVVVAVQLENIGKRAVCCVPGYMLKDSRGRFFSGSTGRSDKLVEQARRTVYMLAELRGDLQPNMPVPHIFVYDVPTDARGFVLSPPR